MLGACGQSREAGLIAVERDDFTIDREPGCGLGGECITDFGEPSGQIVVVSRQHPQI